MPATSWPWHEGLSHLAEWLPAAPFPGDLEKSLKQYMYIECRTRHAFIYFAVFLARVAARAPARAASYSGEHVNCPPDNQAESRKDAAGNLLKPRRILITLQ